jgi:hypothetical protein
MLPMMDVSDTGGATSALRDGIAVGASLIGCASTRTYGQWLPRAASGADGDLAV